MLNDDDSWPVICPTHGPIAEKTIGELRQMTSIRCPRCRRDYTFNNHSFAAEIDLMKGNVRGSMANSNYLS